MFSKIPVKRFCVVLALLLLLGFISSTEAMSFILQPNVRRCFSDESSGNNNLNIIYRTTESPEQELLVTLTGPVGQEIWAKIQDEAEYLGQNVMSGTYTLCFFSKVKKVTHATPSPRTITLKMDSDRPSTDDNNARKKLKPIEDQLRKVEYAIFNIHNEYLYFREKEAEMRSSNENITSKVMWISVMVIVTFLVFSFFQLRHLKTYFRKKRMID